MSRPTRARRIAHEVAEASRATVQGRKPHDPRELVVTARELERQLAKRRKLRKELRHLDKAILQTRKFLKALAGAHFVEEDIKG